MEFFDQLNDVQKQAVESTEGAVLVFAGAGSGKTRVLTNRVAYLVREKGIDPYNILAITFTNKATNEMRERLANMLGESKVWVSTFHSLCLQILVRDADKLGYQPGFSIYDDTSSKNKIKQVLREMRLEEKDKDTYKFHIGNAKNNNLSPDQYFMKIRAREKDSMTISKVYERYEDLLKENNAMDFDDLLIKCYRLFNERPDVLEKWQNRFRYIHVDEFQDTNYIQCEIVKLLSKKYGNIFVVGDDDQSIYGWRGAEIKNILEFDKNFADVKTFKLVQNYRSTQNILDCANNLIKNNNSRAEKELFTEITKGVKVEYNFCPNEYNEVDKVVENICSLKKYNHYTNKDFAVLVRNNALTRLFETNFNRCGLKYKVYGGFKFFDRKEIQDVLAYLRVIANPKDSEALNRIINFPKRGIGDTSIEQMTDCAQANGMSLYEVMSSINTIDGFNNGLKSKVSEFCALLNELTNDSLNVKFSDFVPLMVKRLDLENYYKSDKKAEEQERWENVEEFLAHVKENYDSDEDNLIDFLHTVTLDSDVESDDDPHFITIATMHAVKGLEFKTVFIVACEEGIIPSTQSLREANGVEEERRVMYVAITRARERLYISCVKGTRHKFNRQESAVPSRFIAEAQGETFIEQLREPQSRYKDTFEEDYSTAIPRNAQMKKVTFQYAAPQISPSQKPVVRNTDTEKFRTGVKVSHPKYGVGTVILCDGSGVSKTVTVAFKDLGVKKFAVISAPLSIIE